MNTYIKNSRKQSSNIPEFAQRLNLRIHPNVFKNYIYEFIKINNITYPSELNNDMKYIKRIISNKRSEPEEPEVIESEHNTETSDNISENDDITKDIHIKNKTTNQWISIGKAHVILTWLVQRILDNIIIKSINKAEYKNDAGLYIISLEVIRSIINNETPFNEQFKIYDTKYCNNISYSSMIRDMNRKVIGTYINEQIQINDNVQKLITNYLKNSKDIYYDEKSINYINFLIISIINDILSNIHFLLNVTNKKNMKEDIVYAAIQLVIKKVFWESINVELKQFIEEFYKIDKQIKEERGKLKLLQNNNQSNEDPTIKYKSTNNDDHSTDKYDESSESQNDENITLDSLSEIKESDEESVKELNKTPKTGKSKNTNKKKVKK